jgi:hypothetical protein
VDGVSGRVRLRGHGRRGLVTAAEQGGLAA